MEDDFKNNFKREELKGNGIVKDLVVKFGNKESKEEIKIKV